MSKAFKTFCLLFLYTTLASREVETFYGPIEIEEAVILELIDSEPFQRLKELRQYGVSYYAQDSEHQEPYTRYDHCLGVFAVLRLKDRTLEEQIAGLLHDISHTVFSHVGDYMFSKQMEKDSYQDSIHKWFLREYGLESTLNKYGYTLESVMPKREEFQALDQDLPHLCADRIDYNLQGAFYKGFLDKEEARKLLDDLTFDGQNWSATNIDLLKKLARYSYYMTEAAWGSPENYLISVWLSHAIWRAYELGLVTMQDIHFGTDDALWNRLCMIEDPIIQQSLFLVTHSKEYFRLGNNPDLVIHAKFRGIDPLVRRGSLLEHLTEIDASIKQEYETVKQRFQEGWNIILLGDSACFMEVGEKNIARGTSKQIE